MEQKTEKKMSKLAQLALTNQIKKMTYDEFIRTNPRIVEYNELINSRTNVTFTQFQLILLAVSDLRIEDKSFALTTWKATDLAKALSLSKKNSYAILKKAIKDLANKSVFIYRPELGKEHDIPWLAIAEYEEGTGTVGFKLNTELAPYLLNLKNNFTVFGRDILTRFKTQHTLTFFMRALAMLKRYHAVTQKYQDGVEFSIQTDSLKKFFFLSDNYRTDNLRSKVLARIKKEIESQSDYRLSFKPIKRGRDVVAFTFFFTVREGTILKTIPSGESFAIGACLVDVPQGVNEKQYRFIFDKMLVYGVDNPDRIMQMANYELPRIWANMNYVLHTYKNIPGTEIPRAMVAAIRDNYVGENFENWLH